MGISPRAGPAIEKGDGPIETMVSLRGKFKITRAGIENQGPGYSIPKDSNQSMLAVYERRGRQIPGPDEHAMPLSWKSVGGKFGGNPDQKFERRTFCDDAIRKASKVPSPGKYDDGRTFTIKSGKISQGIEGNYLSDAEHRGLNNPGPCTYAPDSSVI
mmetsp:Transcript_11190/g.18810  ORF Transcript_11190/g.18810 Transcript_11190/m.18810 type:complete len:158 (-) Transcript_11190:360-833(-)